MTTNPNFILLATLAVMVSVYACATEVVVHRPSGEPADDTTTTGGGEGGATTTSGATATSNGGYGAGGADCYDVLVVDFAHVGESADVIVVADNSFSMTSAIGALEQQLNASLAQVLGAAGVDYQIIAVTAHGNSQLNVCIPPPLSGTTDCSGPPVAVPGRFHHYSVNVGSHDALCKLLDSFDGGLADQYAQAPNGWGQWLRAESFKTIIALTDDGSHCTLDGTSYFDLDQIEAGQQIALVWDQHLLAKSPGQLGTPADRRYRLQSIIGLPPNGSWVWYDDSAPVTLGTCQGGAGPGTAYQWLSKGTEGTRYPVCSHLSYDAFFQDIAADIIDEATVICELDLPDAPMGLTYDIGDVGVIYTPGDGAPQTFFAVDSLAFCTHGAFYMDPAQHIVLCPQACQLVESDPDAMLRAYLAACHGFPE
jgi:hypothetical protein